MDDGRGTQDGQRRENQGQGSNPGVGPSQRPGGTAPETVNEGMLSQILAAIQGLAQSNVSVHGMMLEVIQRLPVPAAHGGNEAVSSASGSGSRQPARHEGSQGASEELPPEAIAVSDPVGQVPRAREDGDRYTKEKFMKNGAKEFEGGTNPIKAENWINNMETTFLAMKVPPQQTRLASVMLEGEAYHWWHTEEGSTF